jgi:hypothetical protein
MIFDEVGWDVPGFQNQRVRDLLIAFGTLGTTNIDVFGLYYDPAINDVHEVVFATTLGCDLATAPGTCTSQGIVGNTAIFKIVHDVDFIAGAPVDARRSPCAHLQAAYANGGIPVGRNPDGSIISDTTDPLGRCTTPAATGNLGEEFAVLSPPTRDIIGRSRHKFNLDLSVVTLDFHGVPSQNGEYLNPTGIGHPEFVEINLAALQTPLIFAGEPWNLDRRLGPGGGCDGEPECDTATAIGDPSMSLDPFPYSDLDPGTQAGAPGLGGVPLVPGYGALQRNRTLTYWPLTGSQIMAWPPADPAVQGITPTLHAGLTCGLDDDGDAVFNELDNCPITFNPTQADNDTGGGDGVGDACDNCIAVANANQRDTDVDGFGNVCDADLDNTGLVNLSDFVAFRSVFGQPAPGVEPFTLADHADFDGDGIVNLSDFVTFRGAFGNAPGPSCCGLVP